MKKLCSLLFLLAMFSTPSFADIVLKQQNGQTLLDADFIDISLEDALVEIAEATDIYIMTSEDLAQNIHISYQNLSPEQLLKRLLHGHNAIFLHDKKTGKLNTVRIFTQGKSQPLSAQKDSHAPATEDTAFNENGKYYLTIRINGQPIRMLVDTGANTLAISTRLAAQLGLPRLDSINVKTAAGNAIGTRSKVNSFSMAGQNLHDVDAIILPQLEENGLIGQNVLGQFRHISENNTMRFEPINKPSNTDNAKNGDKSAPATDNPEVPAADEPATNTPENSENEPNKSTENNEKSNEQTNTDART